jgi:hypothetical protein
MCQVESGPCNRRALGIFRIGAAPQRGGSVPGGRDPCLRDPIRRCAAAVGGGLGECIHGGPRLLRVRSRPRAAAQRSGSRGSNMRYSSRSGDWDGEGATAPAYRKRVTLSRCDPVPLHKHIRRRTWRACGAACSPKRRGKGLMSIGPSRTTRGAPRTTCLSLSRRYARYPVIRRLPGLFVVRPLFHMITSPPRRTRRTSSRAS